MKELAKKIVNHILTFIAKGILRRYKPRVIAITGSVGKTSTKDAIYTVLKSSGSVRRSEKSFNSELGVPLSIIGAKSGWNNPLSWIMIMVSGVWQVATPRGNYPKTLVLEVGTDRPGDIRSIAKWLRPHVVVITRLPDVPVHIEFFPTLESLIEEKLSLAQALRKEGTLILNADDPRVLASKEKIRARTLTYGTNEVADIRAGAIQIISPFDGAPEGGITFKIEFEGKSFPVMLPNIYSESFVSVALAALSVAHVQGVNMVTAIEALREYETPAGRVRLLAGTHDTVLIDDTYNSSPTACEAGLMMLGSLPFGKRKIAIVGDMLELGKHTIDAHRHIGAVAKEQADILITVGMRAKECATGAREAGMNEKKIFETDNARAAGALMLEKIKAGDVIFIKGSQGMRMENTVKMLMADPSRAGELLVRQDTEWTKH